ncbi:hypothetical protein [Amycolatopsis palatopharyngis]|nr:hypothetical protein [Amycolatopsis palatopharyngis]
MGGDWKSPPRWYAELRTLVEPKVVRGRPALLDELSLVIPV